MSDQTIVLIAILAFLALALLVLPGALFIRLVELIVSSGFKAVVQELEVLREQIPLLTGMDISTSSSPRKDTLTTPDSPESTLTSGTPATKCHNDSSGSS